MIEGSAVITCPSTSVLLLWRRSLLQQRHSVGSGSVIFGLTLRATWVKLHKVLPKGVTCLSHIWISLPQNFEIAGSRKTPLKSAYEISSCICTTLIKSPKVEGFLRENPRLVPLTSRITFSIICILGSVNVFGIYSFNHLRTVVLSLSEECATSFWRSFWHFGFAKNSHLSTVRRISAYGPGAVLILMPWSGSSETKDSDGRKILGSLFHLFDFLFLRVLYFFSGAEAFKTFWC